MSIVVDSSAIMVILKLEEDAARIGACLIQAERRWTSVASYIECGVVLSRHFGRDGLARLPELMARAGIETVAVDDQQAEIAIEAYLRFGKGSGHRANLNFGDCFAYALAKTQNLPLLFKGEDFIHIDIEPALKPA